MAVCGGVRELEEERANHGYAGARGFFGDGVEVGKQAIAGVDELARDSFVVGAVDPGFVVGGALGGVVAVDGLEGCEFKPLGEQRGLRRVGEAADVGAGEGEAAEAEVLEHGGAHAEMVPGGGVVAGPGDGVALASGIRGAGHDEGALVGIEFEDALVGAARVLHAVNIVDFGMCRSPGYKSGLVDAMNGGERHGLAGTVEDGGLVHVVPEAGEAVGDELLVVRAPPGARLLLGEVGEDAGAGPDDSGEDGAVGIVDEVVSGEAGVVGRVALVGSFGDVKVGDGDGVEVLRL